MAIAFVGGVTASATSGSSVSGAFAATTVAGQLIVLSYADDSATTTTLTSITDSKGNTYVAADAFRVGAVTYRMFYCVLVGAGASHTITATWSTAAAGRATLVGQYFNGFVGTPTLDQVTGTTGTSTTMNPGTTGTTIDANELVVVGGAHASTTSAFTAGAGMSNLGTVSVANAQIGQVSKIVSSTGAQSGTMTIAASRAWAGSIATFRDNTGGGGGPTVAQLGGFFF